MSAGSWAVSMGSHRTGYCRVQTAAPASVHPPTDRYDSSS
ncbi:hypothetical protein DFA_10736 [Cavenderia fasciculata]|uniref:Uncharacterized protein n=1 Tax=Cavenderia fasciculata TaxID=261658 RepID=F4QB91_CACFS|nr:uncharacterized protein DFA_10736 [Cavenderia fasciculata]EGG14863.1 hypothetical protein DFA_10736 [Cavenderia fasciculata]|eukprot:XP_004351379.1 hypothetical protein DFA_10736 [Cavenderia fasciculata]